MARFPVLTAMLVAVMTFPALGARGGDGGDRPARRGGDGGDRAARQRADNNHRASRPSREFRVEQSDRAQHRLQDRSQQTLIGPVAPGVRSRHAQPRTEPAAIQRPTRVTRPQADRRDMGIETARQSQRDRIVGPRASQDRARLIRDRQEAAGPRFEPPRAADRAGSPTRPTFGPAVSDSLARERDVRDRGRADTSRGAREHQRAPDGHERSQIIRGGGDESRISEPATRRGGERPQHRRGVVRDHLYRVPDRPVDRAQDRRDDRRRPVERVIIDRPDRERRGHVRDLQPTRERSITQRPGPAPVGAGSLIVDSSSHGRRITGDDIARARRDLHTRSWDRGHRDWDRRRHYDDDGFKVRGRISFSTGYSYRNYYGYHGYHGFYDNYCPPVIYRPVVYRPVYYYRPAWYRPVYVGTPVIYDPHYRPVVYSYPCYAPGLSIVFDF